MHTSNINVFTLIPAIIIDTPLINIQYSIANFLPLIYENYGKKNPAIEPPAKNNALLAPSTLFLLQYRSKVLAIEFGLFNSSTYIKFGFLQASASSQR